MFHTACERQWLAVFNTVQLLALILIVTLSQRNSARLLCSCRRRRGTGCCILLDHAPCKLTKSQTRVQVDDVGEIRLGEDGQGIPGNPPLFWFGRISILPYKKILGLDALDEMRHRLELALGHQL